MLWRKEFFLLEMLATLLRKYREQKQQSSSSNRYRHDNKILLPLQMFPPSSRSYYPHSLSLTPLLRLLLPFLHYSHHTPLMPYICASVSCLTHTSKDMGSYMQNDNSNQQQRRQARHKTISRDKKLLKYLHIVFTVKRFRSVVINMQITSWMHLGRKEIFS